MFKIQVLHPGAFAWDMGALPTSLQLANSQADNARANEPARVRVVPSTAERSIDIKV